VTNNLSDFQEIIPIAVDAELATSPMKSQITLKLDVLLDQDQFAHVLRATQLMDSLVSHAVLDKSDHQLIDNNASQLQPVQDNMLFNYQLTELNVVDAETVPGQEKCQINSRLLASQDHSLYVIAQKDNLLTDTHVKNAQQVKFHQTTTTISTISTTITTMSTHSKLAIPHNVMDNTRSEDQLLTTSTVEHVKPVNGHNSCQTPKELLVSKDHLLNADHAQPEDQMTDTHALTAQLVQFKIQTILQLVTFQLAVDNTISNLPLMVLLAVNAKHANGQLRFQTTQELLVSRDHSLNAQTASLDNLMTDINANNAHLVKYKTQEHRIDVLLQPVMDNTKSNFHLILNHAVDARTVNGQTSCQTNSSLNASQDQNQLAHVDKCIQLMDILVLTAQLVPSKA